MPEGASAGATFRASLLLGAALLGSLSLSAAPRRPHPKARPPIDFTGVWVLDESVSQNVSSHMRRAVLSVTQDGDRILIFPLRPAEGPRPHILAEEIVADGRPYEKALGPAGTGLVTADWSKDRKSLWIEVASGPPENPKESVQRSVWKISADGNVWIRDSVSIGRDEARSARLVFRRRAK